MSVQLSNVLCTIIWSPGTQCHIHQAEMIQAEQPDLFSTLFLDILVCNKAMELSTRSCDKI